MIVIITNVFAFARSITNVNTFGSRLRHARQLRGLTQAQLARACGLSQGAIGNYESDSRRNAKEIFRIADALKVDAMWLAMGTGSMERPPALHVADTAEIRGREAAWPFPDLDPARIWALSEDQRRIIANALAGMVSALEQDDPEPRS